MLKGIRDECSTYVGIVECIVLEVHASNGRRGNTRDWRGSHVWGGSHVERRDAERQHGKDDRGDRAHVFFDRSFRSSPVRDLWSAATDEVEVSTPSRGEKDETKV